MRAVPFVPQVSPAECGAACLAMVLAYHGKRVGVEALRRRAVSGRDGTSAQTLIEIGRDYGLRGRAVSVTADQIESLERGAILHWNFSHFVVFDRCTADSVHVVDPSIGRRRIPLEHFCRGFSGVAIVFQPDVRFERERGLAAWVVRSFPRLLDTGALVWPVLGASILIPTISLALPLVARPVLNRFVPLDTQGWPIFVVGVSVLAAFEAWSSIVRDSVWLIIRKRVDTQAMVPLVGRLLNTSFDAFTRGMLGDRLNQIGGHAVRRGLFGNLLSAMIDAASAFGYLAALLLWSAPAAMLSVVLTGLQVGASWLSTSLQRRVSALGPDMPATSETYLVETLPVVDTIKSAGAEPQVLRTWAALFAADMDVSLRQGLMNATAAALTNGARAAGWLVVLGAAVHEVIVGARTIGNVVPIAAAATAVLGRIASLATGVRQLRQTTAHLERLNDALEPEPAQEPTCSTAVLTGAIEAHGVSFRYDPVSPPVVRQVSIEIRAGEFVAIVGPSGSGKSTLANLLGGLYVPTAGHISYDHVDLTRLERAHVRRYISVVPQQARLLAGTIRANISLGHPQLSHDAVVRAATLAEIHDDITAMPMGYETVLADRGGSLSAGQQQRIAVARALASEPRVLVLDEATSYVDTLTERAIYDHVAALSCTKIVVAHRLSTLRRAERILVLHDGRLVEQGGIRDLLRAQGKYARLVDGQITAAEILSE